MLRISDARIDGFIAEDVPYVDLTCAVLGIGDEPGEMDYFTREDCVLAGDRGGARASWGSWAARWNRAAPSEHATWRPAAPS